MARETMRREGSPDLDERFDVVVVGAGISGTAAASRLAAAGRAPVILERARGIGGRCAVRRIDGRPVDFGLPFLHGRDPEFLALVDSVPATRIEGWPRVREGGGLPCQPEAFQGRDRVLAFGEGLNALPRHLAAGLDVRFRTEVTAIAPGADGVLILSTRDGRRFRAGAVLLTAPVPHLSALLTPLAAVEPALEGIDGLLAQVRFVPCLTLIAVYAAGTPHPEWDVSLPRISSAVHSILNDSSKRPPDSPLVLVHQAGIGYSRRHLDSHPDAWVPGLLEEAGRLHGSWIAGPERGMPHVWRYARVQRPTELMSPTVLTLSNGARLGLCGDGFSAVGGAEGAWRSGVAAAAAILTPARTTTPSIHRDRDALGLE